MINVLCIYLVNICLIFWILDMLYILVMAGPTSGSGRGRGRPRKHGLPPCTRAPPTPPLRLCPPLLRVMTAPSFLVHIPRSLLWCKTLGIITQGLSLHSPNRLLHLHPHLQELRPAVTLLLRLLLPPVNLIRKLLKPPRPPSHRAPRTSEWSLDTMVNPSK